MVSAVERREHIREVSKDRSSSPVKGRHSPRRRTSPRRERSPVPRKRSPRGRSPDRTYRARSPVKESVPSRARSSKHERQRSPVKASASRSPSPRTKRSVKASASRSPSPRTKRLRRAQAEREFEKSADREHGRSSGREDRDKGRHKERVEVKDVSRDRKSLRENNDGGSSKSYRHDHSDSPEGRSHKSRQSLRSPTRAGARNEVETKSEPAEYSRDDENDALAKMKATEQALEAKEKQKPSFELSGKLAEETNKVRGVTLLFNEPPDARKPEIRWRLYVFKAGEVLNEPLYVHRQSCYLFGRERKVADIPTDHPSCSKQHAVIQYRLVEKEQPDGMMSKDVRPYVMDLGSTNGTYINDNRIEPQRYYELFEKDTIRFGNSSREYVLLHEKSAG